MPAIAGVIFQVSQGVVKEFQLSTVNFDVATGITGVGAVNIVSRSGGNGFHGGAFFDAIGPEFERMATIGNVAPDLWMKQATGAPVGPEALLAATESALAQAE